MSGIDSRIQAFVKLGSFLREFVTDVVEGTGSGSKNPWHERMNTCLEQAGLQNAWFTKSNTLFALNAWGELLKESSIKNWLSYYELGRSKHNKVAIISAGNVPLVGFHDLLCVLITGNRAIVKCSSKDRILLPTLVEYLTDVEPVMADQCEFTEGVLEEFDAVIATGSNNTARYFEYYFRSKPHIIRKNRNSVGVLTGGESLEKLELLAEDIFRYYGLGCRSVSKIFVPAGYNFDQLFKALFKYKTVMDLQRYMNNYDYNKAVFLMSDFEILENGFIILKEDKNYASPIATLYYEFYDSKEDLLDKLNVERDQIQCIVAEGLLAEEVKFGQSQSPALDDYADGIDTVEFLLRI